MKRLNNRDSAMLWWLLTLVITTHAGTMVMGTNFWGGQKVVNPWNNEWVWSEEVYRTEGQAFESDPSNPWNPYWLEELQPYAILRFMDWMKTNGSTITDWSMRTDKTYRYQDALFGDKNPPGGIAYEWLIDLCNRTNTHMWVCIPHGVISRDGPRRGANNYCRKLAILIKHGVDMGNSNLDDAAFADLAAMSRDQLIAAGGVATVEPLDDSRKVYVEYSNEVWNFAFDDQFDWCKREGLAMGLGFDADHRAPERFFAWASLRAFEEFEAVFGTNSPRLKKILGGRHASGGGDLSLMAGVLGNSLPVPTNEAGTTADAFAVAPYFGNKTCKEQGNPDCFNIKGTDPDVIEHMRYSLGYVEMRLAQAKHVADSCGLELIAYEGGQHLTNSCEIPNLRQEMYQLYLDYFTMAEKYITDFVHYTHGGQQDDQNCWGVVASTTNGAAVGIKESQLTVEGQESMPTLEETIRKYPKYRAIVDYVASGSSATAPAARPETSRFETAVSTAPALYDLSGRRIVRNPGANPRIVPAGVYLMPSSHLRAVTALLP